MFKTSMRILVTGAAGSGTSTLGRALAEALSARVFEADDYFWVSTTPPFTTKRDPQERLSSLLRDLDQARVAVIAGSIVDWGAELEDSLSLIVSLTVPAPVRLERLRRREEALFGRADPVFLAWAAQYDEGALPGRSRLKHERWLEARTAPILRIDGNVSIEDALARVLTIAADLPEPSPRHG
jgi:adenylate kinase family enzyme